jgi:3-oxoacyl-[acyl-carrier-protein] synthase-1
LTGVGIALPVGYDAPSATAAIWAGVPRLREIPKYATRKGQSATGGIAVELTADRSGVDRLTALAAPALEEAVQDATRWCAPLEPARTVVLVAVADAERPAYEPFGEPQAREIVGLVEGAPAERVVLVRGDHTAGIRAVIEARRLLREGAADACIVLGVDSQLDAPVLDVLADARRPRTEERAGVIPGEGAACLVLERESGARARGARPLARLRAMATGREPAPSGGGDPSRAEGLSATLRGIFEAHGGADRPIDGVLCDLNGDPFRAREWGIVSARNLTELPSPPTLLHPADCTGDLGAAFGVVLIALAAQAIRRGYAGGPTFLVWCADEGERRAAVLLKEPLG